MNVLIQQICPRCDWQTSLVCFKVPDCTEVCGVFLVVESRATSGLLPPIVSDVYAIRSRWIRWQQRWECNWAKNSELCCINYHRGCRLSFRGVAQQQSHSSHGFIGVMGTTLGDCPTLRLLVLLAQKFRCGTPGHATDVRCCPCCSVDVRSRRRFSLHGCWLTHCFARCFSGKQQLCTPEVVFREWSLCTLALGHCC